MCRIVNRLFDSRKQLGGFLDVIKPDFSGTGPGPWGIAWLVPDCRSYPWAADSLFITLMCFVPPLPWEALFTQQRAVTCHYSDHPRVSNAYRASSMYGITSPTIPEAYLRETATVQAVKTVNLQLGFVRRSRL